MQTSIIAKLAGKQSDKIVQKVAETVIITGIVDMPAKDDYKPSLKVSVLTENGQIVDIFVGKDRHANLKTGEAFLNVTEWSEKSNFGKGYSKYFVNVGV